MVAVLTAVMHGAAHAIRSMQVRGAPLIGATAAYGVALALRHEGDDDHAARALATLAPPGRPRSTCTGRWRACSRACSRCRPHARRGRLGRGRGDPRGRRRQCDAIGRHGLALIREIAARRPGPVRA
jgi:methylthioribose-1-phosphate isomerase